jgi:hypothetical protein
MFLVHRTYTNDSEFPDYNCMYHYNLKQEHWKALHVKEVWGMIIRLTSWQVRSLLKSFNQYSNIMVGNK